MPSLASLLTRDAVVPVELIERALERQTLEGGELDTALLELGAAPENVLAAYRAALFRSEPAGRGELLQIEAAVVDCVTGKHARRFRVVPIAMQEGMLVVASASPLTDEARSTLEAASASPIAVRITTEARIAAALERHYGVNTNERMRKLCSELDARSPGTLVYVDLDRASKPGKRMGLTPPPISGHTQRMNAVHNVPGEAPVHVTRVVELGSAQRDPDDPFDTRPARPSKLPPRASERPPARLTDRPPPRPAHDPEEREALQARETAPKDPREPERGAREDKTERTSTRPPREDETGRTSIADVELVAALAAAQDRVAVEEALLTHTARYLKCAVLLEVRDKHLMGRAAVGLPRELDAASIESAMSRPLQAVVLAGRPRVLDLFRDCPGDALVTLLDRSHAQPCALLPVSLGKRVVIALYGDRDGAAFSQHDIAELCAALPSAGIALERILHERKAGVLEARRSVPPHLGRSSAPPPPNTGVRPSALPPPHLGSRASTPPGPNDRPSTAYSFSERAAKPTTQITDTGLHPPRSHGQTVAGIGASTADEQRDISPELSEAALRSLTPPKSRPPGPNDEYVESNEATPTMVLPRSPVPERFDDVNERERHVDDDDRAHDRDSTSPQRPSNLPPRDGSARLIAQPHKGMGSYAMRNVDEAIVDLHSSQRPERGSSLPERPRAVETAPRERSAESMREGIAPRRSAVPHAPYAPDPRKETRPSDPRREARAADPRREHGESPLRADIVTMAASVRESLRPPATADSSDALNIDLSGEADRLVERLSASTPGEEAPLVAGLLRLGQAGIAALVRRFPGPAWAPRGQLHKRAIAGRDLGPLPRALWAFEDGIVGALTELLEAPHADARLYAAVLAGDRVHSDLLWPLYRRLFDPEGTVRLLVAETLPLYRNVPGFDDVLKSLRKRAADERETLMHRLAAVEAVSSLRDPGSIEVLADLSASSDRQYSIPSQRALIAITGQDFGDASKKWKQWYAKHAQLHRAEWLIESLLHGEQKVRAVAGNELQKLTQVYYGYVASAPKKDREKARDRYKAWWEAEGRIQFGVKS